MYTYVYRYIYKLKILFWLLPCWQKMDSQPAVWYRFLQLLHFFSVTLVCFHDCFKASPFSFRSFFNFCYSIKVVYLKFHLYPYIIIFFIILHKKKCFQCMTGTWKTNGHLEWLKEVTALSAKQLFTNGKVVEFKTLKTIESLWWWIVFAIYK